MPDLIPVLVTGGAGYVGSHVCKALRQNGILPLTYDDLSTGHEQAVQWGPFICGDIADGNKLEKVCREYKPRAVLHFAARAYIGESMGMPAEYYKTNVLGSFTLLEAMKNTGVKHIVFSSTCATYGIPETQPITEEQSQKPINPYGNTKLAVEKMLSDFDNAYGIKSAVLRYFNAAGADPEGDIGEDHDPEPHLIPNVLTAISNRTPLTIHGADYPTPDGTCIRDYVHVCDLATAHVSAFRKLLGGCDSFACNLGAEKEVSIRNIVAMAERVTGKSVPHEIGPRRSGDPAKLVANAARARELLGWTPAHSDIETIIKTAWAWHCRQQAKRAA
ncbi:UDP-glucose 4-epimerase GalE [Kiloniella majae]|uniref:UDP-glucose 4-epimerase GalE n=1 Tax=Kiloniella majae TaxID=1938558 RepID=UPI000A277A1C|nr:UDP-glucose 4-epimerase GalE [Kiloniella majae]